MSGIWTDELVRAVNRVDANTQIITRNPDDNSVVIWCREHGRIKPMILVRPNAPDRTLCPKCFHASLGTLFHPTEKILDDTEPPVSKCATAGCSTYIDSSEKCVMCGQIMCPIHGSTQTKTCYACAEDLAKELGDRYGFYEC